MADEKSIEPVVHEAPVVQGVQPLLPGNPKCYENLLSLREQPDYIRNVKFDFDDPFNTSTNSLCIVVNKYEGTNKKGDTTWGEDLTWEWNEGHGVRAGQRFVRGVPLGIAESFPGPLGNLSYLEALEEDAKEKCDPKQLLKNCKTEVVFSDRALCAELSTPSGQSVYWAVLAEFYENVEKLKIATLAHPDVLQKIKYGKDSLPLNEKHAIIKAASEKREALKTSLDDKIATLRETITKPSKLKSMIEDAEKKHREALSKLVVDLYNQKTADANHRLRPDQKTIDPKKLPPELIQKDGRKVYNGTTLTVNLQKKLFLLDVPGVFKMATDHRLFKEYRKQEGQGNDKQKKMKRDYAAGGSGGNKADVKKPWDYFIEQPNSSDPQLRKTLKQAKDAGLTYQPLTVTRMVPKLKPGGGMSLVSEYVGWSVRHRQPEISLSPGAFGIPLIRTTMGFNAGKDISYRMSIEIGGFQYITESSVFKKQQESLMSGEVSNPYLDSLASGAIGSLFLAPPPSVLALEGPSHDHDADSDDQPRQKRIKAAEAELQECSEDLAQELEEID